MSSKKIKKSAQETSPTGVLYEDADKKEFTVTDLVFKKFKPKKPYKLKSLSHRVMSESFGKKK